MRENFHITPKILIEVHEPLSEKIPHKNSITEENEEKLEIINSKLDEEEQKI